jgi:hypothetical protein
VVALALALALLPFTAHGLIFLTFETVAGGFSFTGSGSGAASVNLGTVSRYRTISPHITRTLGASDYTLATPFGVNVSQFLELFSTSYLLRARLGASSSIGWKVDNVTLTTSYATVATAQGYGTTYSHTLAMVIPNSLTTGLTPSVDLEFLAVAE